MNHAGPKVTSAALLFVAFLTSCVSRPTETTADKYEFNLPGPTTTARVADGYELKNRHVRVVTDGKTGDVVHFGNADGSADALRGQPLRAWVDCAGPASPDGYVELRDEQTWQYLGGDVAAGIGWRKIYCLNGDDLDVTFLIQNHRTQTITATMGLCAPAFDGFTTRRLDGPGRVEVVTAGPPAVKLSFRAFDEGPVVQPAPAGGSPVLAPFLVSDVNVLKPGQRISWTMQWKLTP